MPLIKNRQAQFSGPDFANVSKFSITYKDVFNMDYLYTLLFEYLVEEGFVNRDDEQDFPEISYLQREHPQFGKELWIRWRLKRDESKMFRHYLDIDIHVLGLKDVEVLSQGKKIKANKGELEIAVSVTLAIDPDRDWEKNAFLKPLKHILIHRMLVSRIDTQKLKCVILGGDIQTVIKSYLKIPTYGAEPEGRAFWAKREG